MTDYHVEREWVEPGVDEHTGVSGAWRYSVIRDSGDYSVSVLNEAWSVGELVGLLRNSMNCGFRGIRRVMLRDLGLRVDGLLDDSRLPESLNYVGLRRGAGAVVMGVDDDSVTVFGAVYGFTVITGVRRFILVTGFDYEWLMHEYCVFLLFEASRTISNASWLKDYHVGDSLSMLLSLASMREWCLEREHGRNAVSTVNADNNGSLAGEPRSHVPFPVYWDDACERCADYLRVMGDDYDNITELYGNAKNVGYCAPVLTCDEDDPCCGGWSVPLADDYMRDAIIHRRY